MTAGSPVTILAPDGQVIGSTTLVFKSQDPPVNEVSYSFSASVPAESEYGVEVQGSEVSRFSAQEARSAGVVVCIGSGCTP